MEIISIPLEGDLEHQDSMGNTVIKEGDIQAMSRYRIFTASTIKKDQLVKFYRFGFIQIKKM
jgi:redox-sensitive bicupin YhaK (pirin superfamily)